MKAFLTKDSLDTRQYQDRKLANAGGQAKIQLTSDVIKKSQKNTTSSCELQGMCAWHAHDTGSVISKMLQE